MSSPIQEVQQEHRVDTTQHSTSASAYRPSILLLCALTLWTGTSAISDMIIPYAAIIFSLVTYAPTLYFAAQLLVCRMIVHPPDTRQVLKRAGILTGIWILTGGVHVGLWWTDRHNDFAVFYLFPTIPASQVTLVLMFLAIHYAVDIYMTTRERVLVISRGHEEEPSVAAQPATNEDLREAQTSTPSSTPLYRPSLFLLLVSISLSVCSLIFDFKDYLKQSSPSLAIAASLQAYIPTVLLHSDFVFRILRREMETLTLKQATNIAGLSFDLVPLWIGTRVLVLYFQFPLKGGILIPPAHLLPGIIEVILIVYFAIRYTRSIYAERRCRTGTGMIEDGLEAPTDGTEAPLSPSQPTDSILELSNYYRPPITTLVISIALSTICAIIESLAEPVCGIPMSIIVYAPTIIIHLQLIDEQNHRSLNAMSVQTSNKSMERSLLLCIIWLVTQLFYIFITPVSLYLGRKIMNTWIRWLEVILIISIASRYLEDRYLRNAPGIRLPPDPEVGDSPAMEPPLAGLPQDP